MPVTITSWDPSPSTGGPQEDTEDESGGGVCGALLPLSREKKKRHKEEAAKEKPFKVLSLAT